MKIAAFSELILENSTKSKTKEVKFEELKMSSYLEENKRTSLSKFIFSIRSKTLDIKEYQPWKYETDKCVACQKYSETMNHFAICDAYRNQPCEKWAEINELNSENIIQVGLAIEKRFEERTRILLKDEVGQAPTPDSRAPGRLSQSEFFF